jgi:methionyl-tRNA synthetase
MSKASTNYHLTTAIPYVNGKPHLGHVLEWFQADAIARYQKLQGKTVSFTAGSDENSLKNVQAAEKAGVSVQAWLDEYAGIFEQAYKTFGVELTGFRRGSDQKLHWPGVQELWRRCFAAGKMYKKSYQGLYCVGCEAFYTEAELVDGKCPEHLTVPELVEEENYFFKLSDFQDEIARLIESNELLIVSDQYRKEMLGFVTNGLEDFSVSRSTARARGVGVPVPDDADQIMYVWFDALAIYMTAIGWGYDQAQWEQFWPADVHVIGKGINRFHSVYWIGMLLAAGLPLPKAISVHGYITADGMKMSKSLGNVIDPFELIQKYPLETVRYYLLKYIPTHSDGDFSYAKFEEVYTAELANGLGNLCSRVAKMCEKAELVNPLASQPPTSFNPSFQNLMSRFEISDAADWVLQLINEEDKYLATEQPWKKTGTEQAAILEHAVNTIVTVAYHLQPLMPETAQTILTHFTAEKIVALQPLFPRLA